MRRWPLLVGSRVGPWLLLVASCRTAAPSPPVALVDPPPVGAQHEGSDTIGFRGPPCDRPAAELRARFGSSLTVPRVDVDAVVEGPLAQTIMTLTIGNPEGPRQAEALLHLRLPDGGVFRDLRLEVEGQWQQGRVVPRESAREVYEQIVWDARDPALVEQENARTVSARVFPILQGSRAKVELTWAQPLLGEGADVLTTSLCGLPSIDELYARVEQRGAGGSRVEEARLHNVEPRAPLTAQLAGARPSVIRDGPWIAARAEPRGEPPPTPLSALTILVDTSVSRRASLDEQLERLDDALAIVARRDRSLPIQVLAFDQVVEPIGRRQIGEVGDLLDALRRRGTLGGTDLVGSLEELSAHRVHPRLLVLTDGQSTVGPAQPSRGRALVDRLAAAGVERVDLVSSASESSWWLPELVRHGPAPGRTLGLAADHERLAWMLEHGPHLVQVELPGAELAVSRWVFDEPVPVLVLARLGPGQTWRPREGRVRVEHAVVGSSSPVPVTLDGLVAAMFASARLGAIEQERRWLPPGAPQEQALAERATTLALEHGLLSPHTSLLALESDEAWVRWGLERFEPPSHDSDIQEMKTLESEVRRLEQRQRAQELMQRRYLLALERWARARSAGEDAGPRPEPSEFEPIEFIERREAFHRRLHQAPRRPGPHGRVVQALADGDVATARARVHAWRARDPDDPWVYLAGGQVALARGEVGTAVRWLGSTFELPASHAAYGSGLSFVPLAALEAASLEPMLQRYAAGSSGREQQAQVRRGLEALARSEPVAALKAFDAAGAYDRAIDRLVWLVESTLGPEQRRRVASVLERRPRPREVAPRRLVLVMANLMPGDGLVLVRENRDHTVVSSSFDPALRWPRHERSPMIVEVEGKDRADHILLRGAPVGAIPVVGAAYVLEPDGRGRVRVTHHPFAFDDERTIALR
ncbi:MAG: VIT and VWA domain-containing protein [Myxococcota bacterium]